MFHIIDVALQNIADGGQPLVAAADQSLKDIPGEDPFCIKISKVPYLLLVFVYALSIVNIIIFVISLLSWWVSSLLS